MKEYKVTNTSSKPVFVKGVCLNTGESTNVSELNEDLNYIARKGIVMVSSVDNPSTSKILTEEGTGTSKKRKSSKNLTE